MLLWSCGDAKTHARGIESFFLTSVGPLPVRLRYDQPSSAKYLMVRTIWLV